MIEIDGSYNEGGGQILRTALAFSTLTKIPFHMTNIRKNRPQPGLKNQHLFCIKALEQLSEAKTDNVMIGSDEITFHPGEVKSRTLSINIETAGSITLLCQSILLPCLFANGKVRLKITGGTDVNWAMPFDYLQQVFLPHLRKFCEKIDIKLESRGYYPKGNGKIDMLIHPKYKLSNYQDFDEFHNDLKKNVRSIDLLNQGNLMQIKGISHASMDLQKASVAERQAKSAKQILYKLNCPIEIGSSYSDTLSTGSGITLYAKFSKGDDEIDHNNPVILGASCLGERSKRAEEVGKVAAEDLLKEINSKAAVDKHLADNLVPFLGLIKGSFRTSEITEHTSTNIYTINKFVDSNINMNKEDNIIKNI